MYANFRGVEEGSVPQQNVGKGGNEMISRHEAGFPRESKIWMDSCNGSSGTYEGESFTSKGASPGGKEK